MRCVATLVTAGFRELPYSSNLGHRGKDSSIVGLFSPVITESYSLGRTGPRTRVCLSDELVGPWLLLASGSRLASKRNRGSLQTSTRRRGRGSRISAPSHARRHLTGVSCGCLGDLHHAVAHGRPAPAIGSAPLALPGCS